MKISYKDILIVFLIVTQLFLVFYIVFKTEDSHTDNTYSLNNLSNDRLKDVKTNNFECISYNTSNKFNSSTLNNTKTDNSNYTVKESNNSITNSTTPQHSRVDNLNNSVSEDLNISISYFENQKNNYPNIKNITLSELFMNLPYSNVIKISEEGEGIVKTYTNDGYIINFDVRNYKPNLDNPRYAKVLKETRQFQYGTYYKYTYTIQYDNITSVSYCYYRRVGKYHIIMGFNKEDDFTREMWLRWNQHINNLMYQ